MLICEDIRKRSDVTDKFVDINQLFVTLLARILINYIWQTCSLFSMLHESALTQFPGREHQLCNNTTKQQIQHAAEPRGFHFSSAFFVRARKYFNIWWAVMKWIHCVSQMFNFSFDTVPHVIQAQSWLELQHWIKRKRYILWNRLRPN